MTSNVLNQYLKIIRKNIFYLKLTKHQKITENRKVLFFVKQKIGQKPEHTVKFFLKNLLSVKIIIVLN